MNAEFKLQSNQSTTQKNKCQDISALGSSTRQFLNRKNSPAKKVRISQTAVHITLTIFIRETMFSIVAFKMLLVENIKLM